MSDTAIATARRCLNCAAELTGPFCAQCGQQEQELAIPFHQFMREFFSTVFALDSRLLQSFRQLILRPGYLTLEHYAGRRVRYEAPLRLYLLSSVVFLLLASNARIMFVVDVGTPSTADIAAADAHDPGGMIQALQARWERGRQAAVDNPDLLRKQFMRAWSWTMFLVMPAFALLVSLFFRSPGRFYLHHLVFALHYHAFAFLALSVTIALTQLRSSAIVTVLTPAILVWTLVYLVAALRAVFPQQLGKTILKTVLMLGLYFLVMEVFSLVTLTAVFVIG